MTNTPSLRVGDDKKDVGRPGDSDIGDLVILEYGESWRRSEDADIPRKWYTLFFSNRAFIYCLLATSGTFSISYQNSIADNLVVNVGFVGHVGEMKLGAGGSRAFDPMHIQYWAAAHTFGYLAAALSAWFSIDLLGRRITMLLAISLSIVALFFQLFAKDWTMWLISRIFSGLATGLIQCATIAHLSEVSPTRLRGASLAGYQLAVLFGRFVATIPLQLLVVTSPTAYKRVLLSQLAMIGYAILTTYLLPESSLWCAMRGHYDRGRASLARIYPDEDGAAIDIRYARLLAQVEDDREGNAASLLRSPHKRRLLLSAFPLTWQYWVGVPFVLRYSTYFFSQSGLINVFDSQLILNLLLLLGAILAIVLVDIIGRRTLLLCITPTMSMCLIIIGALMRIPLKHWTGPCLVSLSCVWMIGYSVSVGPLAFVYLGETSSIRLKAKTISIATAVAGLVGAIAQYCTPLMLANHTFGVHTTAFLYSCFGLTGSVACFFWLPETRGLTRSELDSLFRARAPARGFATTKALVGDQRSRSQEAEAGV